MQIHELRREQVLDGTPNELFAFFADAFNLEALTPPLHTLNGGVSTRSDSSSRAKVSSSPSFAGWGA
ncbi:MAG: hypothetical protein M3P44_12250 [Actinomycetota bacterium]|nr:hypothetical protein [Actinomycetota bacterium]